MNNLFLKNKDPKKGRQRYKSRAQKPNGRLEQGFCFGRDKARFGYDGTETLRLGRIQPQAWLLPRRGIFNGAERAVKDTETELAWLIENFLPRRGIFNGAERS